MKIGEARSGDRSSGRSLPAIDPALPRPCPRFLTPSAALHCPTLPHYTAALQTPTKLYLVLDFINGGHLFFQLYRQVGGGGEGQAGSV